MGFINRLFGKGTSQPEKGKIVNHLAFVLLSEAQLPGGKEIASALGDFAALDETLHAEVVESSDQVISLKLDTGETAFVALMPASVPKGEAEEYARFSLSSFRGGWKIPQHCAHLVVALKPTVPASAIVQLSRFTSLLAAIIKSSPAVGVYWGDARATHDSEFFLSVASNPEIVPRIMLWSGMSMAREKDGRLSLLSLGMKQLDLPDVLITAERTSANDAAATLFDLLAYVAQRGEALPEGDTIGATADQKLPVHYVPSPIDPAKRVCRVQLP